MKTYIYPTYTPSRDKSGNLYIKYFHDAFLHNKNFKVVNRFWQIGIASLFFNLDAQLLVVQWVDLIPGKRLGKIQFVLYLMLILIAYLLRKKIVWILHNKHAHKGKSKLVDFGMKFMAKYATCVIAHSEEGISFFNTMYPRFSGKCCCVPHPVYSEEIYESQKIRYDYIIWGGINPHKQVAEFLHYANGSAFFKGKKILVCGRCKDPIYGEMIRKELNPNITFVDEFISDDDLKKYIGQSRVILFTYNGDSVLSSGALIYSINFCKPIIGPNLGNFADENMKEIVSVYNTFDEIPRIALKNCTDACVKYIQENKWVDFPLKMKQKLEKKQR